MCSYARHNVIFKKCWYFTGANRSIQSFYPQVSHTTRLCSSSWRWWMVKWQSAGLTQQTLLTMELHSLVRYPGDVVKVVYLGRQGFAAICAGSCSDSLLVYLISTGAMTDERCFELLSKFTTEEIVDNWIGGTVGVYKPVWECEPGIDSLSVVCVLKSTKYSLHDVENTDGQVTECKHKQHHHQHACCLPSSFNLFDLRWDSAASHLHWFSRANSMGGTLQRLPFPLKHRWCSRNLLTPEFMTDLNICQDHQT